MTRAGLQVERCLTASMAVQRSKQSSRGTDGGGHALNDWLPPSKVEDLRLLSQMGNCSDNERLSVLALLLPFCHSVPRTLLLFLLIKCECEGLLGGAVH